MMELTAKQIDHLNNLNKSNTANNQTLRIAMNYHTNRGEELLKQEKEWWEELRTIHKLDASKNYKIDHKQGMVVIVTVDEDNQEDD